MANEIIVNDQADKVISYKSLSSAEQKQVNTIADAIDITDSSAVIQYGVNIQSEISEFSDSVLSRVKSNESGYVGEVLSELMVKVKAVKVDDIAGSNTLFANSLKKSRINSISLCPGTKNSAPRLILS